MELHLLTFQTSSVFTLLFSYRHDGIIVAISFWQWLVEFIFSNIIAVGVYSLGSNRQVDHFFTLIMILFNVTVIPSFYLMACAKFRRDLTNYGLVKAYWLAVTNKQHQVEPNFKKVILKSVY